ncbi:PREDICTED: protein OBERON 4-like isoform X2 [Nelumbo nucifera]|uniref:Protein OBERON 4-like isoform X2 n=1 Tax=Nelumbo nucifera TaxID=4432 RepID=A0A1U7ZSC6_NELNU|nr:PREDICTED: protein OBERON 4-like isoform X2 [Nelumbo nucifera]
MDNSRHLSFTRRKTSAVKRSTAVFRDEFSVASGRRLYMYDCDDLDSVGEKGVCKDWGRRDQDADRSSSHRRFYSKAESGGRKGLSSSSGHDRLIDDDRESSRSLRKRLDHDSDGFDRRKSFDRYRDCSDRGVSISSPRNSYGGERMHRSESFSGSRREFPKGFRSERDRSRREDSVSLWRRFGGSKDVDEDSRFVSDSSRGSRVASEDRGNVRSPQGSKDVVKSPPLSKDSGGEQSKSVEVKKSEEVQGESGNNSEMEEGELEPETVHEPKPTHEREPSQPEPPAEVNVEDHKELETEQQTKSETNSEEEVKSAQEEKIGLTKKSGNYDGKLENEVSETVTDTIKENDEFPVLPDDPVDGLARRKEEGVTEKEAETETEVDDGGGEKEESGREDQEIFPCNLKPEDEGKKEEIEDATTEKSLLLREEQKLDRSIDLEVEAKDLNSPNSDKGVEDETEVPKVTLSLITDKLNQNAKDKGKSLAFSPSNDASSMEWMERDLLTSREDAMEGPSSRGFELFFSPSATRSDKTNNSGKHKDEKLKMEPLELSLGLPNVSLPHVSHDPNPAPSSPSRARSFQSFHTTNTFRTGSDGFTASISFSGSQPFVHNPSCSLTQNSFDNYEQSVGSHPIFQGVDQVSHGTWQGQPSNDPKRKGVPLYQRILMNGNGSMHASQSSQGILHCQAMQGQHLKVAEGRSGLPIGLDGQPSLLRQLSGTQPRQPEKIRSPTNSVGSHETRSEYANDKKRIIREKSGGSLFCSSSQREIEQLVAGGTDFPEKIITMVVSEPIQIMAKRIHEMTSVACLREYAYEMIVNEEKHGQLCTFQEVLQSRSDLTLETLLKSHRVQLEILVALKTGLQDFLRRARNVPSLELAEIFLNLRCRNLGCKSVIPVDECDCKVCIQKNGFCSACMCLVCSKFDMASNTCSWVGCDVCLHWCHTDCGLRESYIRNGRSATGTQGATEMQFHCLACDHPSEMFGFVKEVFKTCAKDWKAETLSKELEYVKRIFSASNDTRGKQLHDIADQMMARLDNKSNLPEAYNHIMAFLTGDSKPGSTSTVTVKEPSYKNLEGSNGVVGLSQETTWLTPVSTDNAVPHNENTGSVTPSPSLGWDRGGMRTGGSELKKSSEKTPVVDELESIVRIKQAEAKMFQSRADDARREAEGLKRIAIAKNEKIEEEYACRVAKLRLVEAKERHRQKLEELQALEKAHREYFNMKMRMESDIKDLLLKMEATKQNLGT